MAKNKVEIEIDVADKGKIKKKTLEAKKLNEELEGTAAQEKKNERTRDRNVKGAAKTSSNATKNFSKMQQGSVGLVSAYATVAASLFALSAAFEFLKTSADLRVLKEAQAAYAASTGIGLRTLTADLKSAAGGMISFTDAAQAASIGIAAGLSPRQLESFAKGAKDVSEILGRDVTDSFNRLIRGVTKGEPELLDELGIILRLDVAARNYAASLNVAAKDLTQYQKSQAVALEVQKQLDEKYTSVAAAVKLQSNRIKQLQVAFERVIHPVREVTSSLTEAFAGEVARNIESAMLLAGLFAASIVKSMIPSFDSLAAAARESADEAAKSMSIYIARINEVKAAQAKLTDPLKTAQGLSQGIKNSGSGFQKIQQGQTPSERELAALISAAERGRGVINKIPKEMQVTWIASLKAMRAETTKFQSGFKVQMQKMASNFKIKVLEMKVRWGELTAFMQTNMAKAIKGIGVLMRAAGWIGVLILARDAFAAIGKKFDWFGQGDEVTQLSTAFIDHQNAIKSMASQYKDFAQVQKDFLEQNQNMASLESTAALGNFVTTQGNLFEKILKDAETFQELVSRGVEVDPSWYKVWGLNYDNLQDALDDTMAKSKQAAELMIQGMDAAYARSTTNGLELIRLLEKVKEGGIGSLGAADLSDFQRLIKGYEEAAKQANFLLQQEKGIEEQYNRRISTYRRYTTSVSDLMGTIKDAIEQEEKFGVDNDERLTIYRSRLELLQKIHDNEVKFAKKEIQNETRLVRLSRGRSDLVIEELERQRELADYKNQIAKKEAEIWTARHGEVAATQDVIDKLEEELALLKEQTKEVKARGSVEYNAGIAWDNGFQDSLSTGLADLMKGEQSSFSDWITDSVVSGLESVADSLSKDFVKRIFGVKGPADKIGDKVKEGADYMIQKLKEFYASLYGPRTRTSGGTVPTADGDLEVTSSGGSSGHFGPFVDDLKALFSPEGKFLEKLGNVFMSGVDGFKSLFGALLGPLMSKLFGDGTAGEVANIALSSAIGAFGRFGGVFSNGLKQYSTGGVASGSHTGYPAVLHGTEAVVPLPNNRSIPVDLKGAGNQQNNVNVNVNIDQNGQTDTQVDAQGGADLGRLVANAVQRELQNQKRSGGILNRYGVS